MIFYVFVDLPWIMSVRWRVSSTKLCRQSRHRLSMFSLNSTTRGAPITLATRSAATTCKCKAVLTPDSKAIYCMCILFFLFIYVSMHDYFRYTFYLAKSFSLLCLCIFIFLHYFLTLFC